jgi:thioredoxin-related protein
MWNYINMFNTDMVNYAQKAHIRSEKDRCLYTANNYDILVFEHEKCIWCEEVYFGNMKLKQQ